MPMKATNRWRSSGSDAACPVAPTPPEGYWSLLCNETDATGDRPRNTLERRDDTTIRTRQRSARWSPVEAGTSSEIDQFDPQFFGISPREAHLARPAAAPPAAGHMGGLEDGGIPAEALAGTDVGVFIGGFTLDYQLLQNQGRTSRYRFKTHSATGMMMTMLANRISYRVRLPRPEHDRSTPRAPSSLVAVHLAAQSIWNGECDLALAGGVNIMIGPNTAIAESKSGFLSPGRTLQGLRRVRGRLRPR